jgi:hypothetical protein
VALGDRANFEDHIFCQSLVARQDNPHLHWRVTLLLLHGANWKRTVRPGKVIAPSPRELNISRRRLAPYRYAHQTWPKFLLELLYGLIPLIDLLLGHLPDEGKNHHLVITGILWRDKSTTHEFPQMLGADMRNLMQR